MYFIIYGYLKLVNSYKGSWDVLLVDKLVHDVWKDVGWEE